MVDGKIHVGIGFATGRTSFQNVLRSYIFHLRESKFLESSRIALSLFVAFDPSYMNTTRADYENVESSVRQAFYSIKIIGPDDVEDIKKSMLSNGVINESEIDNCFGNGYAIQRNIVVFEAMREHVDYLIFLDDDEYPMAVTQSGDCALWSGQHVIESHTKYLQFSDITNGYHCGYISPLPSIEFDSIVDESTFRDFVESMSSDILSWDNVLQVIKNGGVTYADKQILVERSPILVPEENNAKFITGGNLGLNLTNIAKVLPFYNPPGARGEDSFLSTCLHKHTVKRIPTYTFHDGFSMYGTLLNGVLPTDLHNVSFYDSGAIIQRFYRACIGWVRYKPLYIYITRRSDYQAIMEDTIGRLKKAIPRVCAYFNNYDFENILIELEKYNSKVIQHSQDFEHARHTWEKLKSTLEN